MAESNEMRVGYIAKTGNPEAMWKFREATYTRTINIRGDKIRSKLFYGSLDYDDVAGNARMMKENPKMILVQEVFLLDDELREKAVRWVEWANTVDPSEYDPFVEAKR